MALRTAIAAALVLVIAIIAIAGAAAASSAGGDSIAAAPALPLAVRVANDSRRPEYWRVDLGLADQFVVDIGSNNRKLSVEVCVLHPDVNDYSSDDAPCRAWTSTYTKRQLRFIAPAPGEWIVVVYGCGGCYIFRPLAASRVSYQFTARVHRFTRVTFPPATTRVGRRTTLRGAVQGVETGKLLITQRTGGRWVPLGKTQIGSNGSFSFTTTFYRRGIARIGAVYSGDDRHRPSSQSTQVTVR